VTTLLDSEAYRREEITDLYHERWHVEICHSDYRPSDRLCPGACAA
jgi:hypothetical protein